MVGELTDEKILQDDKKSQLDSNIKKMLENGASREDVVSYAKDFKDKYGVKKKGSSTSEGQKLDSETPVALGSLDSSQKPLKDERLDAAKSISSTDIGVKGFDKKPVPEIDTILNQYSEAVKINDGELTDIDNQLKDENNNKFGFFGNIKNALLGTPVLGTAPNPFFNPSNVGNNRYYNDAAKQLAEEKGVPVDKLDTNEILKLANDNRKTDLIKDLKRQKTEEFIENIGEEDQNKLTDYFSIKANNLDRVSKKNLLDIESYAKDVDVLNNKISEITKEVNDRSEDFDSSQNYPEDYYAYNQKLIADRENLVKNRNLLVRQVEKSMDSLNDNQNDLLSTKEELDLFKRNYGKFYNMVNKAWLATQELGINTSYLLSDLSSINGISYMPGGMVLPTEVVKQGMVEEKQRIENEKNLLRKAKSVSDINSAEDLVEWGMDLIAEQAPNTALLASTGGAGLAVMGLSSGGHKLYELEEEEKETGIKLDPIKKYGSVFITGGAEVLTERISLGQINKAKRVFSTLSRQELKEGTLKYIKSQLPDYVKDVLSEGGSEALSQLSENIADKYLLGKDIDMTRGLTDAFVSGAVMSGLIYRAPGIVSGTARMVMPKDVNQKIGENSLKIAELNGSLANNLSEVSKKALENKRDALLKDNDRLIAKSLANVDKLSVDDKNGLLDIESQKYDIRKQVKSINEDTNITEASRKEVLEDFKIKINTLNEKKEAILKPKENEKTEATQTEQEAEDGTTQENDQKEVLDVESQETAVPETQPEVLPTEAVETTETGQEKGVDENLTNKNIDELEKRLSDIEDSKKDREEFNNIERELEKREWQSVLNSPISEIENIVDELMQKDKDMPNGFGVYIEKRDARETKNVAKKYQGEVDRKTAIKDFKDAFFGNPSTWYADGLKLKESTRAFIEQGGTFKELLRSVQMEFESDGFSEQDAAAVINIKLSEITKTNETTPTNNTNPNADISVGTKPNIQQGKDNAVQPTVEPAPSEESVTTKEVVSGKGTFDVVFNDAGVPIKVTSKSIGKEIPKFIEKKVKKTKKNPKGIRLSKNGIYSTIEADALGTITENQSKLEYRAKVEDALKKFEPVTPEDHVADFFARGGRVDSESAKRETGLSDKEVKWATGFKGKGESKSVEAIAELIAEGSEGNLDEQDLRNAIIDFIKSKESVKKVEQEIIDRVLELEQANQEQELHTYLGSLSEKDLSLYESIKAEDDYISELTDAEVIEYYEQQYESNIPTDVREQQTPKNDKIGKVESPSVQERDGKKAETTQEGQVAKDLRSLYKIHKDLFGLNKIKAFASAVVTDRLIGTMAKREGISKSDMYAKLEFRKGDENTFKDLSTKGKALYQIVGENAILKEEYRLKLDLAKQLEAKGKSPKEIWMATGWERGTDNKWRTEIDDSQMKLDNDFMGMRGYKLGEAIEYKELFDLYPELKDVRVSVISRLGNMLGAYIPNSNVIILNGERTESEIRSTLLHEIQHIIQAKEGFATGGTARLATNYLHQKIRAISLSTTLPKSFVKVAKRLNQSMFSGIDINASKREFLVELNKAKNQLSKEQYALYRSIAGEVESRNVQTRMQMTAQERSQTPLSETEDVARDEQIILFQGVQGAMVAEDGKFIVYALSNPNVSTPLHEMAHVYEHYLDDAERKDILRWTGQNKWDTKTSEKFARGFEKYLSTGKAPTTQLQKIFDKFKQWLTDIYNGIKGSDIDIEISPKMNEIYAKMFGEDIENKQVSFTFLGEQKTGTLQEDGKIKGDDGTIYTEKQAKNIKGSLASKGNKRSISTFEKRTTKPEEKARLKLHEAVLDILKKYAPNSRTLQREEGKKSLGRFFTKSKNIALKSLSDVSVAFHELTHAIDDQFGIIKNLRDKDLKAELENIYLEYYPNAKITHRKSLQHTEGYAMLLQKYIETPTKIEQDYPSLVDAFLKDGGPYAIDNIKAFIKDANKMVEDYFSLNALDKIGARVVDDPLKQSNTVKDKIIKAADRIAEEIADNISQLETLARQDGSFYTADDAAQTMRMANKSALFASNNIDSNKGYWVFNKNGEWEKKYDYNWKTLLKKLDGRKKEFDGDPKKLFGHWLVARRAYFDILAYEKQKAELDKLNKDIEDYKNDEDFDAEILQEMLLEIRPLAENVARLEDIIANDNFNKDEVKAAYDQNKDLFNEESEMYDNLINEHIKLLANPEVGLITNEAYEEMSKNKGYTSFARLMYDEITQEGLDGQELSIKQKRGSKPSFLQKRKGSEKPILNPLLSALSAEAEVIRKAMQQATINKIAKLADGHPDMFQPVEVVVSYDEKTKRASFPQERDPNYIVARKNGKRQAFLVGPEIKRVIEENFDYENTHIIFKLFQASARLFRGGTTGWWIPFLASNIQMDQITASVNTKSRILPYVTSTKEMFNTIVNKNGENRKYFNEYVWLASTSQTSGGWNKQSFRQIDNKLLKKSAGQKAVRYMDRIADVITAPANYSEIMTRATEYIRLRKEGYPQRIALEQAGRVSAPFHHTGRLGGKTGRELIRGIPYANASLQVLAQTARTLRTPEGQKRYAFVASAIVAASTASLLYALSDDDKENEFVKQAYNALSPSELSKAIYFKNPYDNHLFSMRTPEQMTFFSTLTNMAILEHYNGANYSKKEWLQGSDSWLPDQLKPYEGTRWLMSVYPHLLKGVTEVALNKKTFPTVRDIENYADQKKPVEYRFDDWTSPTAKLLANTELAKGLNLSPKKIDHLIGAYGGRSAQFATLKPNRLKIPEVFDRGIYFNASRQMQWYYDFKKHNDEQKSVMNTLKGDEIGNVVKYDALIDIVEDNLKIYREINEVKEPKKADAYKLLIFKFVKILKDQTD